MSIRLFALAGKRSREVPLDWHQRRNPDRDVADIMDAHGIEVAPGVRVALLSHGDVLLPSDVAEHGFTVSRGVMIAVEAQ